ncbi:hypothetical protein JAO29_00965 [Edaphobacter sp. HDX4]|uniref:hypothetical protein n=1 Tax=Edaphobacter sp. HDX4 TaxID=2794064 RepID=UPI002FE5B248
MKLISLLLLLFWQAGANPATTVTAQRQYFLYQRAIVPTAVGQNCAVLDAATFAHAAGSLRDLRLFAQTAAPREVPYAITLSEPVQPDAEPARVLNLGIREHLVSFDLVMPRRPYTAVVLDLAATDYVAVATVTGVDQPGKISGTWLGEFTLFDLTSQHLSRSTTLPLQESTFPYLHVELRISPAPGVRRLQLSPRIVRGASVPPSREAQTVFVPAVETRSVSQRGRQTVARFALPKHVPIERVYFVLSSGYRDNFSRNVVISDHASGMPASAGEVLSGNIFRVRLTQAGTEINQQQLSVPATLGSNLQSSAEVEVTVNNGDDQPLPIVAVELQMRQRRLCFNATSMDSLTLFYGDSTLAAPEYDFARTIQFTNQSAPARVGPEQRNPAYTHRPDTRSLTERHPELVWVAFLAVVCILAVVAIRSSRHLPR